MRAAGAESAFRTVIDSTSVGTCAPVLPSYVDNPEGCFRRGATVLPRPRSINPSSASTPSACCTMERETLHVVYSWVSQGSDICDWSEWFKIWVDRYPPS